MHSDSRFRKIGPLLSTPSRALQTEGQFIDVARERESASLGSEGLTTATPLVMGCNAPGPGVFTPWSPPATRWSGAPTWMVRGTHATGPGLPRGWSAGASTQVTACTAPGPPVRVLTARPVLRWSLAANAEVTCCDAAGQVVARGRSCAASSLVSRCDVAGQALSLRWSWGVKRLVTCCDATRTSCEHGGHHLRARDSRAVTRPVSHSRTTTSIVRYQAGCEGRTASGRCHPVRPHSLPL